jgi:uncharacterized protein
MIKSLAKFAVASLLALSLTQSAFAQKDKSLEKITPAIQEKIKAAIPKEFSKAAKTRKIVVFSKSHGFVHKSTSVGNELLTQLVTTTSAFEVTFNDDPTTYTDEYLKGFDAILVNNATQVQNAFKDANREAFLNFIKNGGSFIGIHAASDGGGKNWLEYSEMIGGQFDGHPWNANGKWAMEVNDTENPINKPFTEKLFIYQDEIYRQSNTYDKLRMHTLLRIDPINDPLKAKEGDDPKKKVVHNREYPISWIKSYGKGKVFYTCFGHRNESFYEAKIVDHMLRGIQWSLGDLEAEMVLGK